MRKLCCLSLYTCPDVYFYNKIEMSWIYSIYTLKKNTEIMINTLEKEKIYWISTPSSCFCIIDHCYIFPGSFIGLFEISHRECSSIIVLFNCWSFYTTIEILIWQSCLFLIVTFHLFHMTYSTHI